MPNNYYRYYLLPTYTRVIMAAFTFHVLDKLLQTSATESPNNWNILVKPNVYKMMSCVRVFVLAKNSPQVSWRQTKKDDDGCPAWLVHSCLYLYILKQNKPHPKISQPQNKFGASRVS